MSFKNNFKLILFVFIMAFLLTSCFSASYTMLGFSYPPGSKLHEGDWEYAGMIIVTSNKSGSDFDISEKTVRFTIKDKEKNKFLDMTLKFSYCGAIFHDIDEVKWDKFEELQFTLYEEIVKSRRIEKDVLKDSETEKFPLCKLKFEYNNKERKFYLTQREDFGGFLGVVRSMN